MTKSVATIDDQCTVDPALQLLECYSESSPFFFASPRGTQLAQNMVGRLEEAAGKDALVGLVHETLTEAKANGMRAPVVIGAVPFDAEQRHQLMLSGHVWEAKAISSSNCRRQPVPVPRYSIRNVPSRDAFRNSVSKALERIAAGEFDKAVLARTVELALEQPLDAGALLAQLVQRNPHGYIFALNLSLGRQGGADRHILLGGSPELLVLKRGNRVISNPLAGSIPRVADPEEDRRRANALLESVKDLHEHRLVIESVDAALRPFCLSLDVPKNPSLISTETMWHLSTWIEGELADPQTNSLELAFALHPTPAVCGYPPRQAAAFIRESESFNRDFFTGFVGWTDAEGNGEWAIALRCAEIADERVRVFAGAGIVEGSNPDLEVAETAAKMGTILNAIGVAPLLEDEA